MNSEDSEPVAMPNPSHHYFNIQFAGSNDAPVLMQVRDMTGRLIEQKNITGAGRSFSLGNNYLPGVYFVQFTERGKTKMLKLVKL